MDSGRRDGLRRETVALLGPGETEILTVAQSPEATQCVWSRVDEGVHRPATDLVGKGWKGGREMSANTGAFRVWSCAAPRVEER